jgi:hypothetical protein
MKRSGTLDRELCSLVWRVGRIGVLLVAAWGAGCAYPYAAGPLRPAGTQAPGVTIADDGTVTCSRDRLEVSMRPMTDEELNRQFVPAGPAPSAMANPYTFTAARPDASGRQPQRFTVFRLGVKNYAFPKVRIDPARIVLRTANGREYWSLGRAQLETYLRAYAIGYRGNAYRQYQELLDILGRTLARNTEVFSGQEAVGLVVFPRLHDDVTVLSAQILEAVLRFDYRNEPLETTRLEFAFQRQMGRLHPSKGPGARP